MGGEVQWDSCDRLRCLLSCPVPANAYPALPGKGVQLRLGPIGSGRRASFCGGGPCASFIHTSSMSPACHVVVRVISSSSTLPSHKPLQVRHPLTHTFRPTIALTVGVIRRRDLMRCDSIPLDAQDRRPTPSPPARPADALASGMTNIRHV